MSRALSPTQYAINPLPSQPAIIDLVNRSVPNVKITHCSNSKKFGFGTTL